MPALPSRNLRSTASAVIFAMQRPPRNTKSVRRRLVDELDPDDHSLPARMRRLTEGDWFNSAICAVIVLSVVGTAADSYDLDEDSWPHVAVETIEVVVFVVFLLEFLLRLAAEGKKPWMYFVGPSWKLNCFDFLILIVSVPGGNVPGSQLRVLRLARLGKLVHSSRNMMLMLMALVDALRSIASIVMLLFFVFYTYAVAGALSFGENDPFHFGTVEDSLLTLFRSSTLEDWSEIMYINVYGCDHDDYAWVSSPDDCTAPEESFLFAPAFFVSFVIVAGMVVLSLFVGVITMSMTLSLHTREEEEMAVRANSSHAGEGARPAGTRFLSIARESLSRQRSVKFLAPSARTRNRYLQLAALAKRLRDAPPFDHAITAVIIASAVVVGVRVEYDSDDTLAFQIIDGFIVSVFVLEVLVKLVAEGTSPANYFRNGWNRFDFVIVTLSLIPDMGDGNILFTVRLLRLLRVLRLIKRVRQLQVITLALIKGFSSIGILGGLMLVFFFAYAIVGIEIFADNDPFHFGTLDRAMLTLFRCSTMEDWTDVLYTQVHGCDRYPATAADCTHLQVHDESPLYQAWCALQEHEPLGLCEQPEAHGLVAVFYFLTFIVLGGLILLSLFVGIVTAAMEEATQELNEAARADALAARAVRAARGSPSPLPSPLQSRLPSPRHSRAPSPIESVGSVASSRASSPSAVPAPAPVPVPVPVPAPESDPVPAPGSGPVPAPGSGPVPGSVPASEESPGSLQS